MDDSDLIQVQWNGKSEWVRPGAKVESLLSEKEWEDCLAGNAIVSDTQGHEVHITGALSKGDQLVIHYLNNSNSEKKT